MPQNKQNKLGQFLNQNKEQLSAYKVGNIEEATLHSSKKIVELQKIYELMKQYDYVKHFQDFIQQGENWIGNVNAIDFNSIVFHMPIQFIYEKQSITKGALLIATTNVVGHDFPCFLLVRVQDKIQEKIDEKCFFGHNYQSFEYYNNTLNNQWDNHNNDELTITFTGQILGTFYPHQELNTFQFTAQTHMLQHANNYLVFQPDKNLLDVIINTQMIIDAKNNQNLSYFPLGEYQETEANFDVKNTTTVYEPISVFYNSRTANFGNTRFGKSNLNKIYISNIIEHNHRQKELNQRLGVLVYDENGEYYHVNTQDNTSIYEKYKHLDEVKRFTLKKNADNNLMLNFYLSPTQTMGLFRSLMGSDNPIYIENFLSIIFTDNSQFEHIFHNDDKEVFKIQLFWYLLYKSGFEYRTNKNNVPFFEFLLGLNKPLSLRISIVEKIKDLLGDNFDAVLNKNQLQTGDTVEIKIKKLFNCLEYFLTSYFELKQDVSYFWKELEPLIDMFNVSPQKGGYKRLKFMNNMHSEYSSNKVDAVIDWVYEQGKVAIVDLSATTNDKAKRFYAERLDYAFFKRAEFIFSQAKTKQKPFILLNYEEAHNLFPISAPLGNIYVKIAREGAKLHIGMVYNTQLVTKIYSELKSLTENVFVGYLNDQRETAELEVINYAFNGLSHEIMTVRKFGYMFVLTKNRRFPIRVQINKFE